MSEYQEIIDGCKNQKGGIIEAFHAIQDKYNYIPAEALQEAARQFGVSEAEAYGVATFYSYLAVEKRGRYVIRMCESAPCHVAGADELLKEIEATLGIKIGETTADGKFTLELAQCVGQCQATPVITINSEPYFNVTKEKLISILATCK